MSEAFSRLKAFMLALQGGAAGLEYKSRGKGRGTPSRNYGNPAGKYTPHQGKKERARRVR